MERINGSEKVKGKTLGGKTKERAATEQGFCLGDILQESGRSGRLSAQSEALAPVHLFAKSKEKRITRQRNSMFAKKRDSKGNGKLSGESEELNSTRSYTSLSRKVSEFDGSKSIINIPKIKFESSDGMVFCGHCGKMVEAIEELERVGGNKSTLMKIYCIFISCWEPKTILKPTSFHCDDCGNLLTNHQTNFF
jgi:hypothetical protein